jgi:hypothetical protein
MSEFVGGDVNAVLRLVKSLSDDGDTQLSILTVALVTACRSCGVDRESAMPIILEAFDDQRDLVPLGSAEAIGS